MSDEQNYDLESRKLTTGMSVAIVIGIAVVVLLCVAALVLSIVVLVQVNSNKDDSTAPTATTTTMGPNVNPPTVGGSPEFKMAAKMLLDSIDASINPCEDFYMHACGKYDDTHPFEGNNVNATRIISFDVISDAVTETMVTGLAKLGDSSTASLKTAKMVYDKCNSEKAKYNNQDYPKLEAGIQELGGWPILTGATKMGPNAPPLEEIMAKLSARYGINTIIAPYIGTKWTSASGYMMHINQFDLAIPISYWRLNQTYTMDVITKEIVKEVKVLGGRVNPNNTTMPSDEEIMKHATKIAAFEQQLSSFNKLLKERRNKVGQSNDKQLRSMQSDYPFFNWKSYLSMLYAEAEIDVTVDDSYLVGLMEPGVYDKLNASMLIPKNRVVIQNYLLWRWLRNEMLCFPEPEMQEIAVQLKLQEQERGGPKAASELQAECANYVIKKLPWQAGRIYVDSHYKDVDMRDKTREMVNTMINRTLLGFESMLELLPWMSATTKEAARAKVQGLRQNSLYPDWILDDTKLNADLANLEAITPKDQFWELNHKLTKFRAAYGYHQLELPSVNREDFSSSPAVVNAWYIPSYNSITFPAAIVNPPFFNLNFPSAVNYGGIGVVMGHELTHGFDDQGVQWGPTGKLDPWMDVSSQEGFQKMADCVIKEYSSYCPRKGKGEPECVSGNQTQGENIADNGGLRASFRAYRTTVNQKGEHDRLPGLEHYTNNQLFFLSFAQVWCSNVKDSRLRSLLLTDPHTPAEERVKGAVRNFPAFAAAFNCKLGDPMFPTYEQDPPRCDVWS